MQSLIKTCALPIVLVSLTACGGGGGSNNPTSSSAPSSTAASSVAPSSTPTSSVAPSSTPASSIAPLSSAVSSSVASSAAAVTEGTQTPANYTNYSIATIENCGQGITAGDKTFAIFADYDSGVQNQSLSSLGFYKWNHVGTLNSTPIPNEWDNITLNAAAYNIPDSAAASSDCNAVDIINAVLVKKIANWHRQHSNGFGRTITAFGQKFGDIKELVVDLRVNSVKTTVHTPETLKSVYSSYLSNTSVIDTNEAGKVNVGFTLETSNNQRATFTIEIDQDIYADKWVRVTIPASSLKYYQGDTPKDASTFTNLVINNLLVVAETRTNAVLRGYITGWTDTNPPPERFKELDLSFKKFEIFLK